MKKSYLLLFYAHCFVIPITFSMQKSNINPTPSETIDQEKLEKGDIEELRKYFRNLCKMALNSKDAQTAEHAFEKNYCSIIRTTQDACCYKKEFQEATLNVPKSVQWENGILIQELYKNKLLSHERSKEGCKPFLIKALAWVQQKTDADNLPSPLEGIEKHLRSHPDITDVLISQEQWKTERQKVLNAYYAEYEIDRDRTSRLSGGT